ncbi:hypothetical protein MHYP_G00196520 [Metynnis hypsauchen]
MPTTHPPADLHPVMRLERFRLKPSVNLARAPAEESARGFRIEWPSSGHSRMQSASTRPCINGELRQKDNLKPPKSEWDCSPQQDG